MLNPYEVLGVSSLDNIDVIKAKYRKLCKKYHPDVQGTGDVSKFREIKEAWDLIQKGTLNKSGFYWSHRSLFNIEKKYV